jgi:hypothetical protein
MRLRTAPKISGGFEIRELGILGENVVDFDVFCK